METANDPIDEELDTYTPVDNSQTFYPLLETKAARVALKRNAEAPHPSGDYKTIMIDANVYRIYMTTSQVLAGIRRGKVGMTVVSNKAQQAAIKGNRAVALREFRRTLFS